MKKKIQLGKVFRGGVKKKHGFATAIDKIMVSDKLHLLFSGLDGDCCADKNHHGGADRALHYYPAEHYQYWQKLYGELWQAPRMGENISAFGLLEQGVAIGDRFRWGEALVEVSQPRSPCFKLDACTGIPGFAREMQERIRCGWLFRVLTPGLVSVDSPLEFIDRVEEPMTVYELCEIFFLDPLNIPKLERVLCQEKLSVGWRKTAQKRVGNGVVEDWQSRLVG